MQECPGATAAFQDKTCRSHRHFTWMGQCPRGAFCDGEWSAERQAHGAHIQSYHTPKCPSLPDGATTHFLKPWPAWKLSVAKVPIYYQLTADSVTAADVRKRVEGILADQKYIFPVEWRTPKPPAGAAVVAAAADEGASTQPMKFKYNLPFCASPIVDIIQETFFAKRNSLGRKYNKLFTALDEHPNELELPDAMAAPGRDPRTVCGALHNWKTGRFQDFEFTQARLETTYTNLLKILAGMREDENPELMHEVMHGLYMKTRQVIYPVAVISTHPILCSKPPAAIEAATMGSARNVIHLDLVDDDND
ncbi:hypothetical protein B0H13DRAFT_1936181 [Mycena leptocephala]|nr:hypothetical protein B0H13DRAFT_1936181 [Mycena leptocephala]